MPDENGINEDLAWYERYQSSKPSQNDYEECWEDYSNNLDDENFY